MAIVIDRPALAPEVAPALEVKDTLEVVVTLADIAQGKLGDPYLCAFSLALRRAGYRGAIVGYDGVFFPANGCFEHTPESRAWMRAFDRGEAVAPERFVLHRRAPAVGSDIVL